MVMNSNQAVDVVIEGGKEDNIEAISLIVSNSLRNAGFDNASRVYLDERSNYVEKKMDLDYAMPSVMTQIRAANPTFFETPIVLSAYQPAAFPAERRRFERAMLQATAMANVFADDEDPDEIWSKMADWEKFKVLRSM